MTAENRTRSGYSPGRPLFLLACAAGLAAACAGGFPPASAQTPEPEPSAPPEIVSGYHEEMTPAEVEAECGRIQNLVEAETERLQAATEPYAETHPGYFAGENDRIDAWREAADLEAGAECRRQLDAAAERQDAAAFDDLYPDISPEIKRLANRIGLTNRSKRILYNNKPLILDDSDHPDFTCGSGFAGTYIHGCWNHSGSIRLLRDNSVATTLAHELLHVIYYREYYLTNANQGIDDQIDAAVAENPRWATIVLSAYAEQIAGLPDRTGRYIKYTELYAFIGTQLADLDDSLEEHYAKYFKDRGKLVGVFHDWITGTRAKLKEQDAAAVRLVDQANEYLACLNDGNLSAGDCLDYNPDRSQYAAYDGCLASRKTFVADCQHLKPPALIAYVPAAPAPADAPADNAEIQILITETEELVDQAQEEQEEDSFIRQLAAYDYESDTPDDEGAAPAGEETSRQRDDAGGTAENDGVAEEEAEPVDTELSPGRPDDETGGGEAEEEPKIQPDEPAAPTPWGWLIAATAFSAGLIAVSLLLNRRREPGTPPGRE